MGLAGAAGNGWTDYSAFNPFYSATLWGNIKLHRIVGAFVRATWKRQRLDLTGYDRPSPPIDPSIIRIKEWMRSGRSMLV